MCVGGEEFVQYLPFVAPIVLLWLTTEMICSMTVKGVFSQNLSSFGTERGKTPTFIQFSLFFEPAFYPAYYKTNAHKSANCRHFELSSSSTSELRARRQQQ